MGLAYLRITKDYLGSFFTNDRHNKIRVPPSQTFPRMGSEQNDLDAVAKPMHEDFRYGIYPRSLGVSE